MKIAITGSVAYDYIMSYPGEFKEMLIADQLDKISVSFLVDSMSRHRGGVATNIAYTLALLGETPILVAAAGNDFTEFGNTLSDVGVDLSGVVVQNDVHTASFFVTTDRDNNQIATFYAGAMARAGEVTLAGVLKDPVDLVVISPNDPVAMDQYVSECNAGGTPYLYDPSQQVARTDGETLKRGVSGATMLIVNEYEYSALQNKTGLTHENMAAMVETIIVTFGEQGAMIYTQDGETQIPAVSPDNIVDPTGVGDAFRSGLLKGIANDWPLELSAKVGALAATYVLEQLGTQNHSFSRDGFVARFRQHFDDEGYLDSWQ